MIIVAETPKAQAHARRRDGVKVLGKPGRLHVCHRVSPVIPRLDVHPDLTPGSFRALLLTLRG
jgi:hypothetical protein